MVKDLDAPGAMRWDQCTAGVHSSAQGALHPQLGGRQSIAVENKGMSERVWTTNYIRLDATTISHDGIAEHNHHRNSDRWLEKETNDVA